jgi:hypothetical protein
MWWKTAQNSLPIGSKLLSIILYSDATNCDTLGKSQLHPIYMSLGNIPTSANLYVRNISKEIAICNIFRNISKIISKFFDFKIFRNINFEILRKY